MKKKLNHNSKARYSKRRRLLLCLLPLLICLVVGVTNYALTFPAITMEGEYLCEKEAHAHGVSCYAKDENGELVLVCDKEEHIHDERCLIPESEPERYICGHRYEHEHEDGCYRDGVLVCTLEEHTHSSNCLADEYRYVMRATMRSVEEPEPDASLSAVEQEVSETPSEPVSDAQQITDIQTVESADTDIQTVESADTDIQTVESTDADIQTVASTDTVMQTAGLNEVNLDEAPAQMDQQPGAVPTDEQKDDPNAAAQEGETQETDTLSEEEAVPTRSLRGTTADIYTENLSTLDDTTVSFTVSKSGYNPGYEIDYENMSGDGYDYDLRISSDRIVSSDEFEITIYTYDTEPKYNDCTLKYNGMDIADYCASADSDPNNPIQETGWAPVRNEGGDIVVWMQVVRKNGGGYQFRFIAPLAVSDIQVKGVLCRGEAGSETGIHKSTEWDTDSFARHFDVSCNLPRYVDDYTQYYYVSDLSTATQHSGSTQEEYSGFVMNVNQPGADFTVTLKNKRTQESFTALPIATASNDPNARFAYLLVTDPGEEYGNLYIFNRADHLALDSSSPLHDHGVTKYAGDDWCLCWQQPDDMELTVSYNDVYGRKYLAYDKTENTAYVRGMTVNQNGQHGPVTADPYTTGELKQVLSKKFDDKNHMFTIVLNEYHLDLGSTSITLYDTMTNAKLPDNVTPTVYRVAPNSETEEAMNSGWSFTSTGVSTFTVVIENPGTYEYRIKYPVERLDKDELSISNSVSMEYEAGQPQNIIYEDSYTDSVSVASNYEFSVKLKKTYEMSPTPPGMPVDEDGVPDNGATFYLYETSYPNGTGDTLKGISRVLNGKRVQSRTATGVTKETGDYPAEKGVDEIVFTDWTMRYRGAIFYIKEEKTADDTYQISDQKIYFYISKGDETTLPDKYLERGFNGSTDASGNTPQEVIILNNWTLRSATAYQDRELLATPIHNAKYHYDLPETGSSGTLVLRAVGGSMILAAVALLIARKRAKT